MVIKENLKKERLKMTEQINSQVELKPRWFFHSLSSNFNTAVLSEEDGFLGEREGIPCLNKDGTPLAEKLNLLETTDRLKDRIVGWDSFSFTLFRSDGGDWKDDPPKIYYESVAPRFKKTVFPNLRRQSGKRTILGTSLLRRDQRLNKKLLNQGVH